MDTTRPSSGRLLSGPRLAPASGRAPKALIVLLHGVGADGQDLIGLAPHWARHLPEAEFLSPDGPEPCDMAPYGRQWFSLQDRTPSVMEAGLQATLPVLNGFLDQALAERGLTDSDLALVGFSQGTMTSLYTALRRPRPCAAVIGYSGALLGAPTLARDIRSRPPVLLVHGEDDPVVPFGAMAVASQALQAAGVDVETLARPGLGHGIDPEGLAAGLAMLHRHLPQAGAA
ncbi:prolyl oligopeptidase family serine peptidase [Mycobacterium sp. KBS0706]|uniref:alpha/beta hydrolase n=1 Tax=Mycobacterium sp. KBS0706 TaxID=2578109 RepID=UPI00110FB848|nr:alpha/beta fold hydrolase [Mycobacterium sp. KBS0706]TSD83527.1 prolyl oligopeptidase family serine peptidase [Mycobacterium sp. KBS0706]